VDHPPPLLRGGVLDRPEQHHAGVVDEHVKPPELGVGALDEGPRLVLLADVRGDRDRPPTLFGDPPRERLDPLHAARGQRYGCALARTGQRGRLADARGGARHGDHLA
jgi:hypothetical protein